MSPHYRPRRLRENSVLREMVAETALRADQLIYPMFVCEGQGIRQEIASLPGQFRLSLDQLLKELHPVRDSGVRSIVLFGIPESSMRDAVGSQSKAVDGIICRAIAAIKEEHPELLLISDVCLCDYTDHGHCGVPGKLVDSRWQIDNDSSIHLLTEIALAYVRAGADVVAPSDMMDGRVEAIRLVLDEAGFSQIPILSYAAKYASAFYGPFRDAVGSAPKFGDRKSYQMDPANAREALREVQLDLEEGADIIMIKPALPYLDVIRRVRELVDVPIAAYQVSGEYAALCAAFERGWLERDAVIQESLLGIARAGADLILTYFAVEAAQMMRDERWR